MSPVAFSPCPPSRFHCPLLRLLGQALLQGVALIPHPLLVAPKHLASSRCLAHPSSPLKPVSFETDFSVRYFFLLWFPKQCVCALLWGPLQTAVPCSLALSCKPHSEHFVKCTRQVLTLLSEWMNFRSLLFSSLLSYVRLKFYTCNIEICTGTLKCLLKHRHFSFTKNDKKQILLCRGLNLHFTCALILNSLVHILSLFLYVSKIYNSFPLSSNTIPLPFSVLRSFH